MGSDPLVGEIVVVVEGVTVGAGSWTGERLRDPGWRGGDATLGDVARFGDGNGNSTLAGTWTGAGTGGS